MILAIDPGKEKCGLAVLDEEGRVIERQVISRGETPGWITGKSFRVVVIGEGAFGRELAKELPLHLNLRFVSEKDSTWQARRRYWRENQPAGWLKFIPTSLLVPPVPIDDYAAIILGERYLLT